MDYYNSLSYNLSFPGIYLYNRVNPYYYPSPYNPASLYNTSLPYNPAIYSYSSSQLPYNAYLNISPAVLKDLALKIGDCIVNTCILPQLLSFLPQLMPYLRPFLSDKEKDGGSGTDK